MADRIPILVGVGRLTQRTKDIDAAMDPVQLMGATCQMALADCGVASSSLDAVATVAMLLETRLPKGYGMICFQLQIYFQLSSILLRQAVS